MFEKERTAMVEHQLVKRGITNKYLLEVMRLLPRHKFLPETAKVMAYGDFAIPIGNNQTMSQPYIVAKMIELLEPTKLDKVLEVGTGSGYTAGILGQLARKVVTVERVPELAEKAKKTLRALKILNTGVMIGDGSVGAIHYYPFDKILISAACPKVPEEIIQQLRINGVIVAPIGDRMKQRITRIVKSREGLIETQYDVCSFVPLIGKNGFDI